MLFLNEEKNYFFNERTRFICFRPYFRPFFIDVSVSMSCTNVLSTSPLLCCTTNYQPPPPPPPLPGTNLVFIFGKSMVFLLLLVISLYLVLESWGRRVVVVCPSLKILPADRACITPWARSIGAEKPWLACMAPANRLDTRLKLGSKEGQWDSTAPSKD